jgi:hypothetical protein
MRQPAMVQRLEKSVLNDKRAARCAASGSAGKNAASATFKAEYGFDYNPLNREHVELALD